jgi:hypothetical protein
MPRIDPEKIRDAQRVLNNRKVFAFEELLTLLGCSIRSALLKLRQWRSYNSYNQNGRYYALPTVPRFDENGLWRFGNVYFSRHGNLTDTVVYLISESTSGLTGKQLGDTLGLSPGSFVHHFRNTPGIRREKHAGVYVYFSDNEQRYTQQVQERTAFVAMARPSISEGDAIAILVALIKHHRITLEDILALPEIKTRGLSPMDIRTFLDHHGFVKKTLDTKR